MRPTSKLRPRERLAVGVSPVGLRAAEGVGGTIDPRAFGLVKAAYSVPETVELLSIGRTSLYAAVRRGELKRIKFGRRTLFSAADLATFLMGLQGGNPQKLGPSDQ
jgi:excisionase family DNA binding protein